MSGATDEQLNNLSKPIPKSLVKTDSRRGKTISYVTARTVMNWLDTSVGRANWKTEYRVILNRDQDTKPPTPLTVECMLSILIDGQWVGKADVGTEDNYSPEKAAYSNALKRAGAQWGIARELYGEGNVYEEDGDEPQPDRRLETGANTPQKRASKPATRKSAPAPAQTQESPAERATERQGADPDDVDAFLKPDAPDMLKKLMADKRTFEAPMWPAFRQSLISAGLATNTFHAEGRLYKVFGLTEEGAKYAMSDVVEAQKEAKLTIAEISTKFQQRESAKQSADEAEAAG